MQAQREDGTCGFVPENYVQLADVNGTVADENEMNVDQDDAASPPQATTERVSAYSATDFEVQETMTDEQQAASTPPPPPPPEHDLVEIPDGMDLKIIKFLNQIDLTFKLIVQNDILIIAYCQK